MGQEISKSGYHHRTAIFDWNDLFSFISSRLRRSAWLGSQYKVSHGVTLVPSHMARDANASDKLRYARATSDF